MIFYPSEDDIQLLFKNNKRIYGKVEILNQDFFLVDSIEGRLISDNYNVDSTSNIRRTYSCVIHPNKEILNFDNGGLVWFNRYIRPYVGVYDYRKDEVNWYLMGTYCIANASHQYDESNNQLSISCNDMMCRLTGDIDGVQPGLSFVIKKGEDIRQSIIGIIGEFGFTKYAIEDLPRTTQYDLEFSANANAYNMIEELMQFCPNFEYFFDIDGTFVVQRQPCYSYDNDYLTEETFSKLVVSESSYSINLNAKNCVEVWGKSWDSSTVDRVADSYTYNNNVYQITVEDWIKNESFTYAKNSTMDQNIVVSINKDSFLRRVDNQNNGYRVQYSDRTIAQSERFSLKYLFNPDVFVEKVYLDIQDGIKTWVFTFDGNNWNIGGRPISSMEQYGFMFESSAQSGDKITVDNGVWSIWLLIENDEDLSSNDRLLDNIPWSGMSEWGISCTVPSGSTIVSGDYIKISTIYPRGLPYNYFIMANKFFENNQSGCKLTIITDRILSFQTASDFPSGGRTDKYYKAIDTGKIYSWDEDSLLYSEISQDEYDDISHGPYDIVDSYGNPIQENKINGSQKEDGVMYVFEYEDIPGYDYPGMILSVGEQGTVRVWSIRDSGGNASVFTINTIGYSVGERVTVDIQNGSAVNIKKAGKFIFLSGLDVHYIFENHENQYLIGEEASKFTVENMGGKYWLVCSGGDYESIISDDLAKERAMYECFYKANLNESLSLTLLSVPWMDVNKKIRYKRITSDKVEHWNIKSVSNQTTAGTCDVSLVKFYPDWSEIYKS